MINTIPFAPSALPVLACASRAMAQTTKAFADSALMLGTGPHAARSVFSSVDILGTSVLKDLHVDHSWELLSRVPGVQVTQFKQGTDGGRCNRVYTSDDSRWRAGIIARYYRNNVLNTCLPTAAAWTPAKAGIFDACELPKASLLMRKTRQLLISRAIGLVS